MSGDNVVNEVTEKAGFALLVAFLWFVWPPLCLLGAGVLLVVWANVRATRKPAQSKTVTAVAAALTAFRSAYRREEQTVELRRVA